MLQPYRLSDMGAFADKTATDTPQHPYSDHQRHTLSRKISSHQKMNTDVWVTGSFFSHRHTHTHTHTHTHPPHAHMPTHWPTSANQHANTQHTHSRAHTKGKETMDEGPISRASQ